jgi:hypothetical protein
MDQNLDGSENPKSPTTGGPMSRIANTLLARAATRHGSAASPSGSETTTSKPLQSSPTGTQPGEHGSKMLTVSQGAAEEAAQIVATAPVGSLIWDPARLLPQCVRSSLEPKWIDVGDDRYGSALRIAGYKLVAAPAPDDIDIAVAIAEEILRPATEAAVIAELGRLRALTVSRDIHEDIGIVFAVYTDELKRYPMDAVREVLREWPRSQRFWPSMAELTERLEHIVTPRRTLRDTLRRGYRKPETSPDWIPPTADEKAAVEGYLAAHGFSGDKPYRRERPLESEETTRQKRQEVAAELRSFRLPDVDDPRVQARLREMGETACT